MIFFFFRNKFTFGEYIHVHSVGLKAWFVKCSQITKFTLKITNKFRLLVIRATGKPALRVFRATRKLMLL